MVSVICPSEVCTGCAACHNICSKACIRMVSDDEGFLRPEIDTECCNDCGACQRVCPALHPIEPKKSFNVRVFACWNKHETTRFQSASGGAFSAFATHTLDHGGVVIGAAFSENMSLQHIAIERKEELERLRGSKYVQSNIGNIYQLVREILKLNRRVLFTGTPCQVAALYAFLGKDNANLLTCDLLCHGVPSPGLFLKFVRFLEKQHGSKLLNINMRHKRNSWHLPSTVASFSGGRECVLRGYYDSYMYGFFKYLTLRPVCYQCPHAKKFRQGDITLADFWGIGESVRFQHSTKNGVSLILVNSDKGNQLFDDSSVFFHSEERTMEEALFKQPHLSHHFSMPQKRQYFYDDYKQLEYGELAKIYLVEKGIKGFIKSIVPRTWIFYFRKFIKFF